MLPSLTRHNGRVTKAWCLSVTRQVRIAPSCFAIGVTTVFQVICLLHAAIGTQASTLLYVEHTEDGSVAPSTLNAAAAAAKHLPGQLSALVAGFGDSVKRAAENAAKLPGVGKVSMQQLPEALKGWCATLRTYCGPTPRASHRMLRYMHHVLGHCLLMPDNLPHHRTSIRIAGADMRAAALLHSLYAFPPCPCPFRCCSHPTPRSNTRWLSPTASCCPWCRRGTPCARNTHVHLGKAGTTSAATEDASLRHTHRECVLCVYWYRHSLRRATLSSHTSSGTRV